MMVHQYKKKASNKKAVLYYFQKESKCHVNLMVKCGFLWGMEPKEMAGEENFFQFKSALFHIIVIYSHMNILTIQFVKRRLRCSECQALFSKTRYHYNT